jgi:hypothetical protein
MTIQLPVCAFPSPLGDSSCPSGLSFIQREEILELRNDVDYDMPDAPHANDWAFLPPGDDNDWEDTLPWDPAYTSSLLAKRLFSRVMQVVKPSCINSWWV